MAWLQVCCDISVTCPQQPIRKVTFLLLLQRPLCTLTSSAASTCRGSGTKRNTTPSVSVSLQRGRAGRQVYSTSASACAPAHQLPGRSGQKQRGLLARCQASVAIKSARGMGACSPIQALPHLRGVRANSYTRSMEVGITLACLPSLGLASLICMGKGSGWPRGRGRGAGRRGRNKHTNRRRRHANGHVAYTHCCSPCNIAPS